ncbi:MAG: TauD/TfdA family dioxygenase [Bdellovibrionaceae bacterium]|nr:TauD/TfdA family dioxygenase [Pseudobdellovibrionaceae bacterium]
MKPNIKPNKPFGVIVEAHGSNDDIRDIDIKMLRDLVWSERLLVLRGFRTFIGADDFAHYCERWGEISIWPFGKVLELVERNNPEDHIFDNNYVPLHWDGMYRPQIPEFQLFHCVKAPKAGQGGRTTFSNTSLALDRASADVKSLWNKVTGKYQRKMEFYDSTTVSPVIDTHPLRGHFVIRYNEPPREGFGNFVNPPTLEFTGVSHDDIQKLHTTLRAALYAPENFYAHEWQEGDLVVADNFSLLHGREAFETKAPRHLRRVHVLSNPPLDNPRLVSHK